MLPLSTFRSLFWLGLKVVPASELLVAGIAAVLGPPKPATEVGPPKPATEVFVDFFGIGFCGTFLATEIAAVTAATFAS